MTQLAAPATEIEVPWNRLWVRKQLEWRATGPQQSALVDSTARRILASGGERGGKTETASQFGVERTFEWDRPVIGWLPADTYRMSWKIFDYLVLKFSKLGFLVDYSQSSPDRRRDIVLADGTVWKTISTRDTENIGQESPDIIIVDEAGQISLEAYHKLRLRQAASAGLLLMIGTVERSQPWYHDMYRLWQAPGADGVSYSLDARTNFHVYPGGFEDPEIKQLERQLPPELLAERLAGIPREPEGLVFSGYFKQSFHVRPAPYIRGLPVSLAVDPGYSQSTHSILAIQTPPDQPIRVIGEVYAKHTSKQMIALARKKEWWSDVADGVIDIAATHKSEKRPLDVWIEDAHLHLLSKKVAIPDGIDRLKDFLLPHPVSLEPQIIIDPSCEGFLSEVGMVHSPITGKFQYYAYKPDSQGSIKRQLPQDMYNHSIKALIYWLMVKYGPSLIKPGRVAKVTYH